LRCISAREAKVSFGSRRKESKTHLAQSPCLQPVLRESLAGSEQEKISDKAEKGGRRRRKRHLVLEREVAVEGGGQHNVVYGRREDRTNARPLTIFSRSVRALKAAISSAVACSGAADMIERCSKAAVRVRVV
jgi:hypothetical protein